MSDSSCGDKVNYQICPEAVDNATMRASHPRGFHHPAQKCEENLVIFLLKGETLVDSQEYTGAMLRAGELILQAIGSRLEVLVMTDVECVCYGFNQPEFFCGQRYGCIMNEIPAPLVCPPLKIIPELQYFPEGSKNYLGENKTCRELLSFKRKEFGFILGYYYSDHDLSSLVHPFSQYTDSLQHFVLQNYMKMKTVEKLARMGGYSVTTFRRIFNTIFHEPVYEWMLKRRKGGIMYDFKHTNATISEICYKYGFESLPHLSDFCKKSFGTSPRTTRNLKDR